MPRHLVLLSQAFLAQVASPGRSGGCPPPLPQIRTCPIKAYGSSDHGFAARLRTRCLRQGPQCHLRRAGASSAIRCCPVHTTLELKVSVMFPSNGSVTRRPLPSTGSPMGRVPPFPRYYEAFRLPADLPAALRYPSVGSTILVRLSSSLPSGPTPTWRPGAFGLGCSAPTCQEWSRRVSQVPGHPSCTFARFLDPGGTDTPHHDGVPARPPSCNTVRATRNDNPFGAR